MDKRRLRTVSALVLLLASGVLSVSTLAVPKKVASEAESEAIRLGFPLWYVKQNRSQLDPPSWPRYYALGSPWEYPIIASPLRFVANTMAPSAYS